MAAAALTVLNSLLTFLGGRLKRKPLMQVRACVRALRWWLMVLPCRPPASYAHPPIDRPTDRQVSLVSNALVILLLTGLCSAGYIIAGALAHQVRGCVDVT